jgi:dihydroorotate dehydrogenase
MAAGFDKDGQYVLPLHAMGFGFVEIGTVTPKPQAGNPKPRLFRLKKDNALINRMGFNNQGVDVLVERLKALEKPEGLIVGGNIGKNKVTPNELAVEDYITCYDALFEYVDYFAINISSPNTPGLRELQSQEPLELLLGTLTNRNNAQQKPKPLFLKIAPDLTDQQLDEIVEICLKFKLTGIIATNTTIDRKGLVVSHEVIDEIGAGGLSGAPLSDRSTEVIRYIKARSADQLIIVGVGGINNPSSAKEKLEAGADLIQVYSGMVYEGPHLVKRILKELA